MVLRTGFKPAFLRHPIDSLGMCRWKALVQRIIQQSDDFQPLADEQLRKKSLALRYSARCGHSLDALLPEAFALLREASRRKLSLTHYPVQLLGGVAMHFGGIAVMQTGEGKTLAATLPLFLAALGGKGAHLATANDYLATRDARMMSPLFESLGISVGVVVADTPRHHRQKNYACDVTYSTAKEIGFDFLRDRLFQRHREENATWAESLVDAVEKGTGQHTHSRHDPQKPVQRQFNFVVVDEADSILIDEARTPLIVSGVPDQVHQARVALYGWASEICDHFGPGKHYQIDPKSKQVLLTGSGRRQLRKLPHPALLDDTPILEIYRQVELAIFVKDNFVVDRHYVVHDGQVVIVDEFTGRLAEGRKWKAGLHQAIEAREGLQVTFETDEAARITIQNLFLRYHRLAGMTGTAANSAPELRKIYRVQVVEIPTNHAPNRRQLPDRVFGTKQEKWAAVVEEVMAMHNLGRPVLVGTRSIDKSEYLSELLSQRGIKHDVLNARHLAREAEIVSSAGNLGRVTVATNMAGRGTDIRLDAKALELGGLHVIGTEMHESARIDRQLFGRCGRQGEPGTYRQLMSFEDDLLAVAFGSKGVARLQRYCSLSTSELEPAGAIFRRAQRKIEAQHFRGRKLLLQQEKLRQQAQREMGQDPYLDIAGAT